MATHPIAKRHTSNCKICNTPILDNQEYCGIHKDKEIQKVHKGFKKLNSGKSYAEYLEEIKRK